MQTNRETDKNDVNGRAGSTLTDWILPKKTEMLLSTIKSMKKYLGVRLDIKFTLWVHLQHVTTEAAQMTAGSSMSKRKLLMNTSKSMVLYELEQLAGEIKAECLLSQLIRIQRTATLRVIAAY